MQRAINDFYLTSTEHYLSDSLRNSLNSPLRDVVQVQSTKMITKPIKETV